VGLPQATNLVLVNDDTRSETEMYETTSTYLQSELDYRAQRIRSGIGSSRRRRIVRVRRPAVTRDAR
jgi:hypothetical protein